MFKSGIHSLPYVRDVIYRCLRPCERRNILIFVVSWKSKQDLFRIITKIFCLISNCHKTRKRMYSKYSVTDKKTCFRLINHVFESNTGFFCQFCENWNTIYSLFCIITKLSHLVSKPYRLVPTRIPTQSLGYEFRMQGFADDPVASKRRFRS